MKILISGSTGFVGTALVPYLEAEGHEVIRLVRRRTAPEGRQVRWNPETGTIYTDGLAGVDAVVHLAGENIAGGRWTAKRKARIRDSRVKGTRLLSQTLARLDPKPKVLVCPSGAGYYGDRGDEVLREKSGPGSDFLAGIVQDWEAAASPAAKAGIRVVNLRFGLVLGSGGGALAKMLMPFKLGLGGRLGSGKQYVSWISLDDALRAYHHALITEALGGPVNTAAPAPVTNAEFTRTLGRALKRPTLLPLPSFALRVLFGELADTLLFSTRMESPKLQNSGFQFHHPDLKTAFTAVLKKR